MDEIQAAVLRVKLKHLEVWNNRRKIIAGQYDRKLTKKLRILMKRKYNNPAYHIYPIFSKRRNGLRDYLAKKGISTLIHYPFPIHLQKAYEGMSIKRKYLHNSENLANEELSLPIGPFLENPEVEYIIKNINDFFS